MAIISSNSQALTLEQALAMKDVNGQEVKFVKQDDGSYYSEVSVDAKDYPKDDKTKTKEPARFKYTYHVTPRPQLATVIIEKEQLGRDLEREIELISLGFDPKDPNAPPHIKVRPQMATTESDSKTKKEAQKQAEIAESVGEPNSASEIKEAAGLEEDTGKKRYRKS